MCTHILNYTFPSVIPREVDKAEVNPHTILYVFLPVLIFESAYAMEAHMFFKSFPQITILAVPGLGMPIALLWVDARKSVNSYFSGDSNLK